MSQSLAKIYVHLIFSTKNREPLLAYELRAELHSYLGGILRDLDSRAMEINTEPDHAHILFTLSRTHTLSDVVSQIKRGSCDPSGRRFLIITLTQGFSRQAGSTLGYIPSPFQGEKRCLPHRKSSSDLRRVL